MTEIKLEKLRAMRKDWMGVVGDKVKVVGRLKQDLLALKEDGKKADIDPVLAFYESVHVAGKAAGRVAILDDLIKSLGGGVPSGPTPPPQAPPDDGGFHIG